MYSIYNILYLINSNKKSVTHTLVTGAPRKYTRHIDMCDVATNLLSTSTEIVYVVRYRRSLNATVRLYYSTVWLAIKIRYIDRPREHVRLFVSTSGITRSSNVTPLDDYK